MIWLLIVPEPLGLWDWLVVALIGVVFLFLMWLCLRRRSLIRYGIAVLLAGLMLVSLLFPRVERAHREYYQGHDQFWWVNQLSVGDKAARHEAALALSDILTSSKDRFTRYWIVQELASHAYGAKELLPVLTEMLKEGDGLLHDRVEEAIRQFQAAAATNLPDDFDSSIHMPLARLGATIVWHSDVPDNPGIGVKLTGGQVTNETLRQVAECLKRWGAVENLDLGYAHITDAGLQSLAGLKNLKSLSLASTGVTDKGLEQLRDIPNLQSLWLTGTQVGDAGLLHLKQFRKLRTLYLSDTRVTDEGLIHLQTLTGLQRLWLCDLPISNSGVEQLTGLSQLVDLNLAATKVSDAGLVLLQELSQLQELNLYATQVTEQGIKKFQKTLPKCRIYPEGRR